MTDDPFGVREGEVAVELPKDFNAGLYFIGRIHTPWVRRDQCPKNARDSDDACDALCTHLAITPREVYPDAEGRRKRHEGARPAGSRKAARGPAANTGRRPR